MKRLLFTTLVAIGAASCRAISAAQATETVWLDALDLKTISQGWGTPQVNRSIREQPLVIGGQKFVRGVATHADSTYRLTLNGGMERFTASVGLDEAAGEPGSVVFEVIADGKPVFASGVMQSGQPAKPLDVDLRGVQSLLLHVTDAGDGIICDHADWANAQFTVTGENPVPGGVPKEAPYLLTPKPAAAPRLNGPKVYGARPGHPFLYRIPAQGERPMTFSASGLPQGLQLDAQTGIITGTTPPRGEYNITLRAKNSHGRDHRGFKLVSGDTLALTPPMGWNSWYAHYARITDPMMRAAVDIMIRSGMADVGYQYVNIDACWAVNPALTNDPTMQVPPRDANGNVQPNRKFPDMKAVTDYIHGRGLKAGLYSSPGPWDCMLAVGSWLHEEQDAQAYANWGFDFLKYDWCSYDSVADKPRSPEEMQRPYPTIPPTFNFASGRPLDELKRPYQLMGGLLRQQPRDIVLNLCQ